MFLLSVVNEATDVNEVKCSYITEWIRVHREKAVITNTQQLSIA